MSDCLILIEVHLSGLRPPGRRCLSPRAHGNRPSLGALMLAPVIGAPPDLAAPVFERAGAVSRWTCPASPIKMAPARGSAPRPSKVFPFQIARRSSWYPSDAPIEAGKDGNVCPIVNRTRTIVEAVTPRPGRSWEPAALLRVESIAPGESWRYPGRKWRPRLLPPRVLRSFRLQATACFGTLVAARSIATDTGD